MRTRVGDGHIAIGAVLIVCALLALLWPVGCASVQTGCAVVDLVDQGCEMITVRYRDRAGVVRTSQVRADAIRAAASAPDGGAP